MARKTKMAAQETRTRLLDAAVDVFHAEGVSRATLAGIASAAGVTRGAVYWHFRNKTDLFHAMFDRVRLPLEEMAEVGTLQGNLDPLGELRRTLIYLFEQTGRDPAFRKVFDILFNKWERVAEFAQLMERDLEIRRQALLRLERVFRNAAQHGQLPATVDVSFAAVLTQNFVSGTLRNWLTDTDSNDLAADAPRLADAILELLQSTAVSRRDV